METLTTTPEQEAAAETWRAAFVPLIDEYRPETAPEPPTRMHDACGFEFCGDCKIYAHKLDQHERALAEAEKSFKAASFWLSNGRECFATFQPTPGVDLWDDENDIFLMTSDPELIARLHAEHPKGTFTTLHGLENAGLRMLALEIAANKAKELGEIIEIVAAITPDTTVAPPWAGGPVETKPPAPSLYVDVAALLAGNMERVLPTIGGRTDGLPFIYAGAVNVLFGNPEAGKTLVASALAADELFKGGSLLWVDLDYNGPTATISRFRSFGVSVGVLSDPSRFRMVIPEDKQALLDVVKDAATWNPTIAVVDSVGELLSLFGANPNSDEDYAPVHRAVLSKLADTNAAVVAIDHEAKGQGSRDYGASGAVAKKRAIDGVMLRVSVRTPFVPGKGGKSDLTIVKDRHGGVREISPAGEKEPLAAKFELLGGPATDWKFWAPGGAPTKKAAGPASDLDQLKTLDPEPKSIYDVRHRMGWGGDRSTQAFRMFKEAA